MSLSFPSIWVPGSSFILASCFIGKEAISSILLDQWFFHVNINFNLALREARCFIASNCSIWRRCLASSAGCLGSGGEGSVGGGMSSLLRRLPWFRGGGISGGWGKSSSLRRRLDNVYVLRIYAWEHRFFIFC